jgi:hypothetical protein
MLRPGAIDDTAEFDQLLSADVVIADLSTLPSGVIYKLGIRHGLRPRTTIVITANEIPPLDLNQRVIRYEHAGRDIGFHETTRFRQTLTAALKQATESAQPDSPLYYHLPDLHPPSLHDVAGPPSDTGESVAASSTDRRGQRSCFVVMGFGEKTDFETGRLLNLDKSYQNIIKPAAIESGLDCRRADEMATTSGLINAEVLRELLTADLVIADLSTNNTDTLYMLGMRHALSPHGTLLIAEHQFRSPFSDSLHMYIRTYEHLGQDIRFEEVMRLRQLLKDLIPAVLASHEIDSPVYRQLTALSPPYLAK